MTRERSPSAARVNAETVYSAGREADLVMTSTAEVRTSRHGPVRVSTVRESYWSIAPKEENILWDALPGGNMTIATEILSLRQNQSSSVETLLAAIEWERAAQDEKHILSRHYAVREAADIVLLNVAVHAADALSQPTVLRGTRRGLFRLLRKPRRSNPGGLHQRRLLAV